LGVAFLQPIAPSLGGPEGSSFFFFRPWQTDSLPVSNPRLNFYACSLYGLSEDIAQRVLKGAIKKKVLTAKTIRVKVQLESNKFVQFGSFTLTD
jgi:hypothetical protein